MPPNGHLSVAALLLSRGASAAAQKSQALVYAAMKRPPPCSPRCCSPAAPTRPPRRARRWCTAAERGHLPVAALLLSRGADAAAQGSRRWRLPPNAATSRSPPVALPRRRRGRPENRALMWAAKSGHLSVAALLLSRGADAAAQESLALVYAAQLATSRSPRCCSPAAPTRPPEGAWR